MAAKAFLIAIFVAFVVASTSAIDHMVGGEDGWKLGVDYTAWAEGKDFRVGDTLTFMYKQGFHNVLKVNGSDFKQCLSTNTSVKPLISGNDVVTLANPGKKWYICGVAGHCSKGMQFSITVSLAEGPAPAPTPTPGSTTPTPDASAAANEISPLKYSMWMLTVMAALKLIVA
ncbi:mavicyanin-like [Henckelia pumila]|uniref:mavicyanin-like n=1 Tax=Henckelia pumila TaxID=405737 RepID=UPI003C6E5736